MIKVLVYLEDGNVVSYEVTDVHKAMENAFRVVNEGWRTKSCNTLWMVYHVPENILKIVIQVPPDQEWAKFKNYEQPKGRDEFYENQINYSADSFDNVLNLSNFDDLYIPIEPKNKYKIKGKVKSIKKGSFSVKELENI